MLKIETEYRRGILFIRLEGILNKKTSVKLNNEIGSIIDKMGLKYIVFNIENIVSIDINGVNTLLNQYKLVSNNKGRILVCGFKDNIVINNTYKSKLLSYIDEINNELSAFEVINL
ncbi:MAG: STAS domain-containing protein [Bacilli bacterium]|nr:STAS domain-containing protein [Bacilli bacterium]